MLLHNREQSAIPEILKVDGNNLYGVSLAIAFIKLFIAQRDDVSGNIIGEIHRFLGERTAR